MILASVLVMKKHGLFEVYVGPELVHSTDSEDDALDKIQDLALQYYESGHPDPSTISFVRHGETQSFPDGEGFY